jgi:hypothetical protein
VKEQAVATTTFEGFSITAARILDVATGALILDGDVYGVREGKLDVDTGDYDNTGNDAVLSSWFWFNYASVSIQSGYIPFKTIALLTGTTVTSSGTAPSDYYSVPLWSQKSLSTIARPMLVEVPSKDSAGALRKLQIILYKVQFQPMTFDGPTYKDGLSVNYSGRALISSIDEKGTTLTDPAIGRLYSIPG